MRLTPAQLRMLEALEVYGSNGATGSQVAVDCGYKGITHQTKGGASRAPIWTGHVAANMPSGYVRSEYSGGSLRYYLTRSGMAILQRTREK